MNNMRNKFRMSTTAKILLVLVAVLAVASLVFYGRVLWYYPHHPPLEKATVPAIDEENIAPEPIEYTSFRDRPVPADGHVVIDLSHANNLQINDLTPLQDRIRARGATLTTYTGAGDSLEARLIDATALVVIAPSVAYSADERDVIADFVDDGGLLMLTADPTRPVPDDDEFVTLYSTFFPTSAVPVINSLANAFGVIYYDDYLYNLEDNQGNFRNVKFSIFDKENALTKGLKTVVFFGCHSLRSEGGSLVAGDDGTHSSVRTGESNVTAATVTADDHVLALGDITFLTPPYNTVEDNDRLVSNIADWLAADRRMRDDLEDFPYFFTDSVDVLLLSDGLLDPQMIASVADWQEHFSQTGLDLTLHTRPRAGFDRFYVGTFDSVEPIEDLLEDVDITVSITEDADRRASGDGEDIGDHITIERFGGIPVEGTSLFLLDLQDPVTLIVLAEDTDAAVSAVERLFLGDLSGCVRSDTVTVCSTGQGTSRMPADGEESTGEDTESPSGGVFIIEDDYRPQGSRTGAAEFEAILSSKYNVTTWSVKQQGIPEYRDMLGYDVYIFDSGDYAADPDSIDALLAIANIDTGGIMLIGAQPVASAEGEYADIGDLRVVDPLHPLASGFEAEEIIKLGPSESGVPAITMIVDESSLSDYSIIFERGPDSEETGSPAVLALSESYAGAELRLILATFAFYRLPETAQETFALNSVSWLMGND